MTPRKLRPYQEQAVQAVFNEWGSETRRTAVVLPTGTGKSTVIAKIAAESHAMGLSVVMLAHRGELLDQMAATVAEVDPAFGRAGIVRAEADESHRPIVAASFQTLMNDYRLNRLGQRRVILTDECFVAGTPVDGRPIETLRPGDTVTAWSEQTRTFTRRRVVRTMASVPSALVRVTTTDDETFICTPGHPFLTPVGWVPAGELSRGVQLHHANALQAVRYSGGDHHEVPARQDSETRLGVLREGMFHGVPRGDQFAHDGGHEPEARVPAYAGTEPYAQSGNASEGFSDAALHRAPSDGSGRERDRGHGAAILIGPRAELGYGSGYPDDGRSASAQVLRGHREPHTENRSGSGRAQSQHTGSACVRRAEDRPTGGPRVESVAFLEPGSDGRYGGLCPDGLVYNIEVESDHTYTVGTGVVVHNCHHVTADSYRRVVESFGSDTFFCGFTATLRRSDGKALRDMIDSVAYEKNLRWAIGEGHLVPPTGITVKIPDLDLGKVKTTAGDFAGSDLAEVMEAETDEVVKAILKHCANRHPIVFAASVQAAHDIADALSAQGMPAQAVTGAMSYADRQPVYDRFRSHDIQALVTVMVLTEGADFPMCDAVVIARPTQSQNLYSQMVGRALRLWRNKTDALVLDLVGTSRVLKLVTLASLDSGAPVRKVDTEGDDLPPEDDEEDLLADAGLTARPKNRRMGPIDTIGIDLLGPDETGILWMGTEKGVPFIAPPESGQVVFLWEAGYDHREPLYRVGHMARKNSTDSGWLDEGRMYPLALAKDVAEDYVTDSGWALPLRAASWRKYQPPSEAQLRYARSLGILDAETLTKARLSDEITITLVSRRLDPHRP